MREARAKAEAEERARAWVEAKARKKADTTRIVDEDREKLEPEARATARAKEKSISARRMAAESGADTRVKVEAKYEVRDRDVGILTVILNKVKAASNGLKSEMVGAEEETKEKAERSMADVEAEERAEKRIKKRLHYRTCSKLRWNIGRVRRGP